MAGELFRTQTPKISLNTNSSLLLEGLPMSPVQEHNQEGMGFPSGSDGKESASNAADLGSIRVGKISWRREWLPTPVFLPGEFREQRSLAGAHTCARTHTHTHTQSRWMGFLRRWNPGGLPGTGCNQGHRDLRKRVAVSFAPCEDGH